MDQIKDGLLIRDLLRANAGTPELPLALDTVVDPLTNRHSLKVVADIPPPPAPVGGATEAKQDVQIALSTQSADFSPGYGPQNLGGGGFRQDPDGQLLTRGPVLTDEGTFRVNFANTSLEVSIGTITAIAGNLLTGSGFSSIDLHKGDYVKLNADPQTSWAQVDEILSDTQIRLVTSYIGGASGAASRALMAPLVGAGGSIAVASGQATIASGTTASSTTELYRAVDYAPLVYRSAFSISQRIANQNTVAGLEDQSSPIKWFARFRFDGTVNTVVICETGRNPTGAPSAAETQSVTVTLPPGLTTAQILEYRIELLTERVVFYINGIQVAENTRTIPSQHDEMGAVLYISNLVGFSGTNTNVVADFVTCKNHDKLEVGVMSNNEQIVAATPPAAQFTFSQAGIIAINTDLIQVDCTQFRSLSIQVASLGTTGVITVQWSNDKAFSVIAGGNVQSAGGATSATITAAGIFTTPAYGQFCRIRLTTATTTGTTTLFVSAFQNDAAGSRIVTVGGGTVAVTATNLSTNLAQVAGTTTVTGGVAGSLGIGGTTAAGTAVANNPVQVGAESRTTQRAATADGVVSRPIVDSMGRLVVKNGQIRTLQDTNFLTLTGTTETTLIASVVGVFHDVYTITVSNSSATAVRVDFRDSTAGTIRWSPTVPAGGYVSFASTIPMRQATAANNWTAQLSAAVTDVRITTTSERAV